MSTPTLVILVVSAMFLIVIGAGVIADRRDAKRRQSK